MASNNNKLQKNIRLIVTNSLEIKQSDKIPTALASCTLTIINSKQAIWYRSACRYWPNFTRCRCTINHLAHGIRHIL
jgi:hypothetical protein